MSYAIRFLPADPLRRDEPAMYLSTENFGRHCPAILTSVSCDVAAGNPAIVRDMWVRDRCERDRLVADVVPLDVALADCRDVDLRPGEVAS